MFSTYHGQLVLETCRWVSGLQALRLKAAVRGLARTEQPYPSLLKIWLVKQILDDKSKQEPNSVLWTAGLGEGPHLKIPTFQSLDLPSSRVRVGLACSGKEQSFLLHISYTDNFSSRNILCIYNIFASMMKKIIYLGCVSISCFFLLYGCLIFHGMISYNLTSSLLIDIYIYFLSISTNPIMAHVFSTCVSIYER